MRPVALGQPISDKDFARWAQLALREIENASYEDIAEVADAFSISGTFTETYSLNVSAPTIANVAAVLATLITDMQKRGTNKTG